MGKKGESAEKIKGKIFPSYSYNLYEGIFAF